MTTTMQTVDIFRHLPEHFWLIAIPGCYRCCRISENKLREFRVERSSADTDDIMSR